MSWNPWFGIHEPWVVDLIQSVGEFGILLITEKENHSLLNEEKVQQESKELKLAYDVKNEFDALILINPP